MKLTIGMPCYNNFTEVWFTIQSLRLYQDLSNVEILVVDNYGDEHLKNFITGWCSDKVRYFRYEENKGTAAAKNIVFEQAKGEFVICMDSHVMLVPGAIFKFKKYISNNPDCMDLLQGPLIYDNLVSSSDSFSTVWSDGMWGQWNNIHTDRDMEPYEIPMMGMGFFACRKDAWLGFNKDMRGFGGEEGYIHEKYRKHGRKTMCLPFMQWLHHFRPAGTAPHTVTHDDKIRNYTIGFMELGLDMSPLYKHFGEDNVKKYIKLSPEEVFKSINGVTAADIFEHVQTFAEMAKDKRIVEFGVRNGSSTTGWIYGRPKRLVSYDLYACPRIEILKEMAKDLNVEFSFHLSNSLVTDIEECDILFIDTLHNEKQLSVELNRHAPKTREYIVMHDTVTFGYVGEDGTGGLNRAIYLFLADNHDWYIDKVYHNNNGLTILKRRSG